MRAVSCVIFAVLSLMTSPASSFEFSVVEMTYDLGLGQTPFWPDDPPFSFDIVDRGRQEDGYWFEFNSFCTSEHAGTHADAPAHFSQTGWRAHQIPASNLVGPAAVIDVKQKAATDPNYQLCVADIQAWENTYGTIPDRAVVLMNSGRGVLYPNASLVYGTDTPNDPSTFHFPGIHPDAADFLAKRRHVIAVGVDTPSVDHGQTATYGTHITLSKSNVIGLEFVRNLGQLPPRGAIVVIGMLKLYEGSGSPARILGLVPADRVTEIKRKFHHSKSRQ